MTTIYYNNINPFQGIGPTPLVAQRNSFIKYGEQWGEVTHLTLRGVITGFNLSGVNQGIIDGGNFYSILDGGNFYSNLSSGIDGGGFSGTIDGGAFVVITGYNLLDGGNFLSGLMQAFDGGNFAPYSGQVDGGGFLQWILDGGNYLSGNTGTIDGGAYTGTYGNSVSFSCPLSYGVFFSGQAYLISNFSQDFQTLQIIENNSTIVSKPYSIIKKINFPSNNYIGIVPYEIDIDCYESNFFSGVFGVLEPKNEFSFVQNKDQSINIQHSMSCRGFNTSSANSNALQNAKNYISQISGFNGQVMPYFINVCSGMSPSLIASVENIDRVQSTYAVTETYILDPFFSSGVLRYAATYDSGIKDGISTVKIAGNLRSSRNYSIEFVRQRYTTFDPFSAAVDAYSVATNGMIDLNPFYISSGITVDPFAKTINFDIVFNNDQTLNPYLDYTVNFNYDAIRDVTAASFQGTVKGRGELQTRYNRVLAFASGVNIYGLVAADYAADGYQYTLNPFPTTSGITRNPFNAEVGLRADYNDQIVPVYGFDYIDYSFKFVPALEKYSAVPILNGSGAWQVTDLGFANRAVLNLDGKAVINPGLSQTTGINLLTNYVNYLVQPYINGKNRVALEAQEISWGNAGIGQNLSFSVQFTYEDNILNI